MKVLVTYYTTTGNTRKVAEAIHKEMHDVNAELAPVEDVRNQGDYDVIVYGFPVHAHSVPVPVQDFLKNLKSSQKLALFSTHGALKNGRMAREAIEHAIGLARNVELLGSFACRGEVDQKIIDSLMGKPEHMAWTEEAASAKSHPDEADLADARTFARGILKKVLTFKEFAS